MADEDRTLGPDALAEDMDVGNDLVPGGRRPGGVAVPRKVDRDAPDVRAEVLDHGVPGAAVEREPVQKDDRHAGAVFLVGEGGLVNGEGHWIGVPFKRWFCHAVT